MSLTLWSLFLGQMEGLVRRLKWILTQESDAKFVIFSTWEDVLEVAGQALAANGISFVRAKGRRYGFRYPDTQKSHLI